jgi:glycosyltransferase involved in cell wall biosynthesis
MQSMRGGDMSTMKVAFYNHTSDVSGAEISMLLTARYMTAAEPILFAPEGELLVRAEVAGIRTVSLPSYRARLSRNPLQLTRGMIGMAAAGFRFAREVKRHQVAIIHANSLRAGIMASLFAWYHKRPVIWHVRDNPPGGSIGACIQFVARRSAKALVCISKAVCDGFDGGKFGRRLQLVHNGVDLEQADAAAKLANRTAVREQLNTAADSEVLAIIGQITPWKRQEDAIRAAARLIGYGRNVVLWIVGEAKFRQENIVYEQELRMLAEQLGIADRVRFTGFRSDIAEVVCAIDLLLLCSDKEPFGRVLIEAMSQSVPVIATNAGGVPEIVDHEREGHLYEVGDVIGLTEHAAYLLTNPSVMAAMGEAAARKVKTRFKIQNTVSRIESIYRDVLGESSFPAVSSPIHPRVAIVHDYLNQMGGAERVVAVLHRMYPDAPIFTTIADRDKLVPELRDADVRTTWMQRIPGIFKHFKLYFWLYPLAVRSIRLQGYDIIVSSSSAYAKGINKPAGSVHVCYCHTPMRFAWDFDTYIQGSGTPKLLQWLARPMQHPLRMWDVARSRQVDHFIANSSIVQQRIDRSYGRSSRIIYPPVDISRFGSGDVHGGSGGTPGDYFLIVSRLVSYKRIDLAIEACNQLSRKLIIIGDGPDRGRLTGLAGPSRTNIQFRGRLADHEVTRIMKDCRALLFPGLEDFGITPLEANACGRPVIAFRGGGALDTISPGVNGMYFDEPCVESLALAMMAFESMDWDGERIRRHAERFEESRFCAELGPYVLQASTRGSDHNHEALSAHVITQSNREGSVGS